MAFSSLGLGCAIGWYLFFQKWMNSFGVSGGALPPLGAVETTMISLVTVVVLGVLAVFGDRLESEKAQRLIFATGFSLCAALIVLVQGISCSWLPFGGFSVAALLVTKVLYGFVLCVWIQSLSERSVRATMAGAALSLLLAGCFSLLFLSDIIDFPFVSSLLLVLPFAAFAAARLVCRPLPQEERIDLAVLTIKNIRVSVVAVYAVLMGFATTQFYVYHATAESVGVNVVSLVAAGVLLVFIALYLGRMLDIVGCFFLSAVLFAVVILFWFALPEMGALITVTTGSIHWASFVLLAAASCARTQTGLFYSVSRLCGLMALFRASSLLSTIALVFGVGSYAIMSVIALVLLFATLALAYQQRRKAGSFDGKDDSPEDELRRRLALGFGLTPRETEVFCLLAEGNTLKHIAEALFLSENTVKRHRANVYRKVGVGSRQELIDLVRSADELS